MSKLQNRHLGSNIPYHVVPALLPQLTRGLLWDSLQPLVGDGKILGLVYRRVSLICWCELEKCCSTMVSLKDRPETP